MCVACGYAENADVVGAINILERGQRLLACAEEGSGRGRQTMTKPASVKQEPTEVTAHEVSQAQHRRNPGLFRAGRMSSYQWVSEPTSTLHKEIVMKTKPWVALVEYGCVGALGLFLANALAQDFPIKPIKFIVPFAAGSGSDQAARTYAQVISSLYGVPVLVDPKPGGNGFIAVQNVAKAQPDGYTALYTTNTTHAANAHLYKNLPYDPVKDFAPVALLSMGHMSLVVNVNSKYKSVEDIVLEARKRPGELNFGSGSSSSRVASEMFKQLAGIDVKSIPYKSNPMSITDLMGGQIDFMFTDAATGVPQIQSNKLRALAVSGLKRLAAIASVPTMEEAGIKGYDMSYWNAVFLPAGTPLAIVNKFNEMLARASTSEPVQNYLRSTSSELSLSSPEGLAQFQANESVRWGKVIKQAGIEPE